MNYPLYHRMFKRDLYSWSTHISGYEGILVLRNIRERMLEPGLPYPSPYGGFWKGFREGLQVIKHFGKELDESVRCFDLLIPAVERVGAVESEEQLTAARNTIESTLGHDVGRNDTLVGLLGHRKVEVPHFSRLIRNRRRS